MMFKTGSRQNLSDPAKLQPYKPPTLLYAGLGRVQRFHLHHRMTYHDPSGQVKGACYAHFLVG